MSVALRARHSISFSICPRRDRLFHENRDGTIVSDLLPAARWPATTNDLHSPAACFGWRGLLGRGLFDDRAAGEEEVEEIEVRRQGERAALQASSVLVTDQGSQAAGRAPRGGDCGCSSCLGSR